jgi:hypothetical protein
MGTPIANLRLMAMSPSFAGHSRTTREPDDTEHEEELHSNDENIGGALCNTAGGKGNEEGTLIIENPYKVPYLTASSDFRANKSSPFGPQNKPPAQEMEWEYTASRIDASDSDIEIIPPSAFRDNGHHSRMTTTC